MHSSIVVICSNCIDRGGGECAGFRVESEDGAGGAHRHVRERAEVGVDEAWEGHDCVHQAGRRAHMPHDQQNLLPGRECHSGTYAGCCNSDSRRYRVVRIGVVIYAYIF